MPSILTDSITLERSLRRRSIKRLVTVRAPKCETGFDLSSAAARLNDPAGAVSTEQSVDPLGKGRPPLLCRILQFRAGSARAVWRVDQVDDSCARTKRLSLITCGGIQHQRQCQSKRGDPCLDLANWAIRRKLSSARIFTMSFVASGVIPEA